VKGVASRLALGTMMVIALGPRVATSTLAAPDARIAAPTCRVRALEAPAVMCSRVPRSGRFSVTVPGTPIELTGVGTPRTAGVSLLVAKVAAPGLPQQSYSFKVMASGRFPALRLARAGFLLQLVISTGRWRSVKAITHPGIYADIPR
jgi:hypothetical protein